MLMREPGFTPSVSESLRRVHRLSGRKAIRNRLRSKRAHPLCVTSVCRRPNLRNMSITVSMGVWSVTVMGACQERAVLLRVGSSIPSEDGTREPTKSCAWELRCLRPVSDRPVPPARQSGPEAATNNVARAGVPSHWMSWKPEQKVKRMQLSPSLRRPDSGLSEHPRTVEPESYRRQNGRLPSTP